jgi:hypothetical protein
VRPEVPSKARPGMAQARPQGAPGAPLGAPWDITGAPGEVQRRTLARPGPTPAAGRARAPPQGAPGGAPLGAPWVRPGIAQAHPNEGACAKVRLLAGPGPTLPAHAPYRGCAAAPPRRAPRSRSQLSSAQKSKVRLQGSRYLVFTFLLVCLVYKAGTGCIGSCCSMQRHKPACCKGLSATRSGTSPFPPSSKSGRAGRRSWLAHRLQALTRK